MSQSRLAAIAVLGLTTVTAAGIAYQQYQRAEALTRALAESNIVAEIEDTPPSVPEDASPLSPQPNEVASAAAETEAEESTRPDRNDNRGRFDRSAFGNRMQELMADPEYAQAFQKQQRARLDGPYADLFARLNLPPATLNALQNLLVEKQNAARDVFMAAREEGLGGRENRDQLRELLQLTQDEIDAQIAETIGEQNYETLKAYESTGPQREVVDRLESRLSYSATPLNDAQAQALTTILAETTTPTNSGRGNTGNFGVSRGSVSITDETITRAQGVLSADQLDSLVALQEEQQASQQISQIMRREAQAARGGGGGGRGDSSTATPIGGGG